MSQEDYKKSHAQDASVVLDTEVRALFSEPPKASFNAPFMGGEGPGNIRATEPISTENMRKDPATHRMDKMQGKVDDFDNEMRKWTSDAALSKDRQRELVGNAIPLSRELQIPRDFHINRDDLNQLHVLLENEQKFAHALLALANIRYGNVGYDHYSRAQSVAVNRESLREIIMR